MTDIPTGAFPLPPTSVTGELPPLVDTPGEVPGDRVYMSISWLSLDKEDALRIRDAALAAAPRMASYSVSFSSPPVDE